MSFCKSLTVRNFYNVYEGQKLEFAVRLCWLRQCKSAVNSNMTTNVDYKDIRQNWSCSNCTGHNVRSKLSESTPYIAHIFLFSFTEYSHAECTFHQYNIIIYMRLTPPQLRRQRWLSFGADSIRPLSNSFLDCCLVSITLLIFRYLNESRRK